MDPAIKVQMLIVAYGREGLDRLAAQPHPVLPGLEYIVSWQYAGCNPDYRPESLACRNDFRILPSPTRGVSVNRNLALDAASAPICITSDDDVAYTSDDIRNIITALESRPDCQFISFRYHPGHATGIYPDKETDLATRPKGYVIGGMEMAFRLEAIRKHNIRFNERFGVGCEFVAGEEDLFLHSVLKKGLSARFIPMTCATHPADSTAERRCDDMEFIRTKGAVVAILHPLSWPLRLVAHALRFRSGSRFNYIRAWLKGVWQIYFRKPEV